MSSPEGRPTDTIYANPFVADVNGTRMFFSGGSDGAMHALKIATGEKVWSWPVSQRGLNTAALVIGIGRHRLAQRREHRHRARWACSRRCRPHKTGTLTDKDARWLIRGVQAGYASPVTDGQRIYVVDNGGILFAHDAKTGTRSGSRTSARSRSRRPCWPTASCTSARRTREPAASSTSSGRLPIAQRSSIRTGSAASRIRTDRRLAGRRARPGLRRLDGRALRDRSEDGARGRSAANRPAQPPATVRGAGPAARCS